MGKPTTVEKKKKKKRHSSSFSKSMDLSNSTTETNNSSSSNALEDATNLFVEMADDNKNQGNLLFQTRDYESAVLSYEKAIELLPKSHPNIPVIHTNVAACYFQMGSTHYHLAINQCNLALQSSPNYTKALLKRARCFEGLDRLGLAQKDVDLVLSLEPNNLTALEIAGRIRKAAEAKGEVLDDKLMIFAPEIVLGKDDDRSKKKKNKKRNSHHHHKHDHGGESKVEEKVVVEVTTEEAKSSTTTTEEGQVMAKTRMVKMVFGEDIRCANVDMNCTLLQLREVVRNRFPSLKAVLIKFKDKEGDLMTITNFEELRWAEESGDPQGSVRLYITEVDAEHEPVFEEAVVSKGIQVKGGPDRNLKSFSDFGSMRSSRYEEDNGPHCIDNWIIEFARLFRNHVGFDSDEDLDLHELGIKLYSEVLEDTVTSEESQEIFETAEGKFEEMAAVALFNWGNVYMSRAKKRLLLVSQNTSSKESMLEQFSAYEWARSQYILAGQNYEEALRIKPDFYEGFLGLGHQQFEQAKLCLYDATRSKVDQQNLQPASKQVLEGFMKAQGNMERGVKLWEELEMKGLEMSLSAPNEEKALLENMGLADGFFKDVSNEEAIELVSNMRSQINLVWGTMLYERSGLEFKLGLPIWEDTLMASTEKFKLAGVSQDDLAVMIKNHTSSATAQEGLGFKIDEILVPALNGLDDVKKRIRGIPSFRLEPLLRRRVSKCVM